MRDTDINTINSNVISYMNYISDKKMYFQIVDSSGKKIYNDFKFGPISNKGQWNIVGNEASYEVNEIKGKDYLYA